MSSRQVVPINGESGVGRTGSRTIDSATTPCPVRVNVPPGCSRYGVDPRNAVTQSSCAISGPAQPISVPPSAPVNSRPLVTVKVPE